MKKTPQVMKSRESYERELNRLISQEIGNEREIELFVASHLAHLSTLDEQSPASIRR